MSKGYYGLSFPFRVSSRGGLAMTGTNHLESPHISESIRQILGTVAGERLRSRFGSNLSTIVFEPNDETAQNLLQYEIREALKQDSRIEVGDEDIEVFSDNEFIYAKVKYKIIDYTNVTHEVTVNLGGVQ